MNILVLSCGTRNKIIQYFRRELEGVGRVVAADKSEFAPALYEADKHYIVPDIEEKGYMEVLVDICRKEAINGVLSLIDPELSLLARNEKLIEEAGTRIIGSPYEVCERSLDKYQMYLWLKEKGYARAKTYANKSDFIKDYEKGAIRFPVMVKPARGSASIEIRKVKDLENLEVLTRDQESAIIQEYINGQEIGADCYIDLISGEVVSIFTKRKIAMRAGETDKAVSMSEPELTELIERFCKEGGYRGEIDIDLFEMDGNYIISEVNPRFGGGYPHAYECGCNHMRYIVQNLKGEPVKRNIGNYKSGITMMKYSEIRLLEE